MKKIFTTITMFVIVLNLKAQIRTSEVKVEQTNNVTTISGSVDLSGLDRTSHFNFSTAEDTYIRGGKLYSNVLINDNGGNVGIGTNSPDATLHVERGTANGGTAEFGGSERYTHFNFSTDEDTYIRGGKFNSNVLINDNGGNVGIGTTSPSAKLNIDPLGQGGIKIGNSNSSSGNHTSLRLEISAAQNGYSSIQSIKSAGSSYGDLILNNSGGNVGIGTNSPDATLHVERGTANGGTAAFGGSERYTHFNFSTDEDTYIRGGKFNSNVLINDNGGNVGIGTVAPNYKLEVLGTVRATTFNASAGNPWPDFVFAKGFELRTLEEVEQHITENGHLPEIPSEAEVNENGINLGEMNSKLLQKIEELTLYMIDMNKRMNQLETENQELKGKVKSLENK